MLSSGSIRANNPWRRAWAFLPLPGFGSGDAQALKTKVALEFVKDSQGVTEGSFEARHECAGAGSIEWI